MLLLFFLAGVKEECIYAQCVGLAEGNTMLTKPLISKQQSLTQEKQEAINLVYRFSLELNNAAIEVKKKEIKEEKIPTIFIHSSHG